MQGELPSVISSSKKPTQKVRVASPNASSAECFTGILTYCFSAQVDTIIVFPASILYLYRVLSCHTPQKTTAAPRLRRCHGSSFEFCSRHSSGLIESELSSHQAPSLHHTLPLPPSWLRQPSQLQETHPPSQSDHCTDLYYGNHRSLQITTSENTVGEERKTLFMDIRASATSGEYKSLYRKG